MIITSKSNIKLRPGHTFAEYIIKQNEKGASYAELGAALKLSFYEMRDIYDRVSALQLSDIGKLKGDGMS